jgi:hypothetical protein
MSNEPISELKSQEEAQEREILTRITCPKCEREFKEYPTRSLNNKKYYICVNCHFIFYIIG